MMKKIFLIITLLFGSSMLFAQMSEDSAQVYMQQANKLYEASEYGQALELYHNIEQHYRSPILFFNIGNCYFKTSQIPNAILYYERSLKYDPQNENTLANLKQAHKFIADDIQALPANAFSESWNAFVKDRSINFWANLSIYLMITGFLVLLLTLVKLPDFVKKFSSLLAGILIVAALFTFLLARSAKNNIEMVNHAIVFTPKVDVMSEPKSNGSRLFVIHEGLKVEILANNDDWYEIKLANGEIGWILKEDCKVI